MRATLRLLPLPLLVGLSACGATNTGCDPARAGFLESMNCSQGGFQSRQAYLQQNLADAQANALEQRRDAARAHGEAVRAQRDLAARQRALAGLNARLSEMRGDLSAASRRPGVDAGALGRARQELDALQHSQARISPSDPNDAQLRENEERQRRLYRDIKNLL